MGLPVFRLKISTADKYFSLKIRNRADWKCERCFTQYEPPTAGLHCSHFWGRGMKSVRFDEDNAAALCFRCHQHMTAFPLEHVEFFKKRLGEKRFDALRLRAHTPQKVDEKMIAMGLKMELKEKGWLRK